MSLGSGFHFAVGACGVFAARVEFDSSATEGEGAELLHDLGEPRLDDCVVELDDLAAVDTDEVVVLVVFAGERVVACLAVAEVSWLSEGVLDEELEGPIDGRVADVRSALADFFEELFDRDVLVESEEGLDDDVALSGGLESFLLDALVKALEGLLRGEWG